jgi:hypothetical protein
MNSGVRMLSEAPMSRRFVRKRVPASVSVAA